MRQDFNKLLTERERIGHSRCFGEVRHSKNLDTDDRKAEGSVTKQGMKHRHLRSKGNGTKSFNENLNPLRNFIRDNVGRPWNKVYGEICQTFDKRKVINQHILQHLFQDVETDAKMVNGKVCTLNTARGSRPYDPQTGKYSDTVEGFYEARWVPVRDDNRIKWYVHPVDGLLKLNKHRKTSKQLKDENARKREIDLRKVFKKINDLEELHKINGVWYVYTLKQRPAPRYKIGVVGMPDAEFAVLSTAEKNLRGRKIEIERAYTEIACPNNKASKDLYDYRTGNLENKKFYYVSAIAASRKLLKAYGLDGTAEFKEEETRLSHRDFAKYRKAA